MSTQPSGRISPEEYLAIERSTDDKSEFFHGEMFAMGGASRRHNLVVLNFGAELRRQLSESPCETYVNDMRVKVDTTGLYTYPDVVVVCDDPQFDDASNDTLLNPLVIAEVLSKSTESYDRGKKFEHYRHLESLREYLLIAQDEPHVEHYRRQSDNTWVLTEIRGMDQDVDLPIITGRVATSDIYAKVQFDVADESRDAG